MSDLFLCPKCRHALTAAGNTLRCPEGHSYDKARSGYVNLLLSGGGKNHGDDALMLASRRRFLSAGHYLPLCRAVAEAALAHAGRSSVILDVGCGEGYYSEKILSTLTENGVTADYYGIDISKKAADMAAKTVKAAQFAVASAYALPFAEETFDLTVNLFSPLAPEEIYRVLKPKGIFILAVPDTMHLYELKCAVYKTPYQNPETDNALPGFRLLSEQKIAFPMHLTENAEIVSLFEMTPYYYKTAKEDFEKLLSIPAMTVQAAFKLLIYQRK